MKDMTNFFILCIIVTLFLSYRDSKVVVFGVQILSKSKLEKCEKSSADSSAKLNCTRKIVLDLAVPTGTSGGEASIVAELVEVEENSTNKMQNLRIPPVITVNKSAVYALYELTYIRDVAYKPEEYYVKTRKCESDAGANVVKICERLKDEHGNVIAHTEPRCCPCGPQRRVPSSCGNFFDKVIRGKANTAHCLRYPGDWFHVFGIGQRSLGFSVRIEVKTGSRVSEVIIGPENKTVASHDKFLRVNLIGDFVGYASIPSFEEFYLVVPRQGDPGQPHNLGRNFSMWMLLERVRFTLDGLECNKIGVSYEAYNGQPDFCSAPFWSCLHNQLWNFWEADRNRVSRKQVPLYGLEGRFERINQHPDAGTHSFSIGVTEDLKSNIVMELNADDIDYVYQKSPGKIISVTVPTFEALTQFGTATVMTKNTGEVEASYSLTFDCSRGVTFLEEQYFIMKSNEVLTRSFKLYPTTDQAAKYVCAVILKDSEFNEVDRAECQFTTTSTVLDNGSQINPFQPPKSGMDGFFGSIQKMWKRIWEGLVDFITGRTCRAPSGVRFSGGLNISLHFGRKCSGFFDFSCHIQYICMSWIVLFSLLLAIFPTVLVLIWLLHQKGLFDPLYDWWEDHLSDPIISDGVLRRQPHTDYNVHQEKKVIHKRHAHNKARKVHIQHGHMHTDKDPDYYQYIHHVHKNKHKHQHNKNSSIIQHYDVEGRDDYKIGLHGRRKEKGAIKRVPKMSL